MEMTALPGGDLIEEGIEDLRRGIESTPALLVAIGRPRLSRLGYEIPKVIDNPEQRLYSRLADTDSDSAHSRYNSLIRRLVSFERAASCVR